MKSPSLKYAKQQQNSSNNTDYDNNTDDDQIIYLIKIHSMKKTTNRKMF